MAALFYYLRLQVGYTYVFIVYCIIKFSCYLQINAIIRSKKNVRKSQIFLWTINSYLYGIRPRRAILRQHLTIISYLFTFVHEHTSLHSSTSFSTPTFNTLFAQFTHFPSLCSALCRTVISCELYWRLTCQGQHNPRPILDHQIVKP